MPHVVRCATLHLHLDDLGRPVRLHHVAAGIDLLAAEANAVGLWQVGLIEPTRFDDPLPALVKPALPYEGHEWLANRLEYQADLLIDAEDAPPPLVEGDADALTLTWTVPIMAGELRVRLDFVGGEDADGISCTVAVQGPTRWTIKRVVAPRLRGFGDRSAPELDAVLYPLNWGVLRQNPLETTPNFEGQYPSGMCWGQLTAWLHGEAGVYLAIRDPDANHTGLDVQYVEGRTPAPVESMRWYASNLGREPSPEPGPLAARLAQGLEPAIQMQVGHWPAQAHSWESPYPVLLQGISGGWEEAARLHRGWTTKQRWCAKGRLHERTDASTALADLDVWVTRYGFHPGSLEPTEPTAFREAMLTLYGYLGVPFGVHWYNWHAFSWHRAFPRHAPAVEGFGALVQELQALGIVIMPYCQGRLLYPDRPAFEMEASHASIEHNGQPYMEQYTPQDEWPLALCPASGWAQKEWAEAARLLWRHYGVDGVYYDQISAMPPNLCYHEGHGHPLGGGDWYVKAYRDFLTDLQPMRQENPRRFLSSELQADAFLDLLDVYLAFVPPMEDYVPLFPAVYGGYSTTMGRATPDGVMQDPQLFAICQGEQLIFGGQLGWFDERILKYPEAAALFRDYVHLRGRVRDILHLGEMLPSLALTLAGDPAPLDLSVPGNLCGKKVPLRLQRAAVRHTVWLAPDGRRLIMLLNEAREAVDATLALPAAWPTGPWTLWHSGAVGADGDAATLVASTSTSANTLTVTLQPFQAAALVLPA